MRKIFLFILLFISVSVAAQTPSTTYKVPSVTNISTYFGNADRLYVVDSNRDYVVCNPCLTDSIVGAGGRKWKKLVTVTAPITFDRGYVGLGTVPIANGGTNNGSLSVTNQNIVITDGSKQIGLAKGSNGQHLIVNGSGNLAYVDSTAVPTVAGVYLPLVGATYTTTTGSGLALVNSTLTTGNLVSLALTGTAAASNTKTGLAITSSGTNGTASQTVTGETISVINVGTTNTNVGLNVTASGATNNYAALFTGSVGIGTATPDQALQIVSGNAHIGNAFVGNWPSSGSFAAFGDATLANTIDYAFLQNNDGSTWINTSAGQGIHFLIHNSEIATLSTSGKLGIGQTSPTALLHIKAGAAAANSAPLKFTTGINLTTPEVGAVEYDGTDLFFTPTGTIRKSIPTSTIGRSTAQTAAVASIVTETVGASDASYLVSANVLVTTATVHSFTATVTYTDEGNTSRTLTLQFSTLAGAFITAMTNAQGTVPYEGVPLHIRAKSGTTITLATTGTFTTVVYNVEGMIQLLK